MKQREKSTYHHLVLTLSVHLPRDIKRSSSGLCNGQFALRPRLEIPCDVRKLGMSLHFGSGERPIIIPKVSSLVLSYADLDISLKCPYLL